MTREVYILMKYKHSNKFYTDRYNKYKKEMRKLGIVPVNKGSFISAYEALAETSKNPMKDIIYSAQYGTSYKTALAEKKALATIGIEVKLKELKIMTTQDFADIYANELATAYRNLRSNGVSGADAAILISQQWFGSN